MNYIWSTFINLCLFLIIYLLRRLIFKEGFKSFLIHLDRSGIELFIKGFLLGVLFFCLHPIFTFLFSDSTFVFDSNKLMSTFTLLFKGFLIAFSVALFEEALFRGFLLQKLIKHFSYTGSIVTISLIFGGLHFFSYASSPYFWIGLINASLVGIILSIWVLNKQSLMLAFGYHLSWNLVSRLLIDDRSIIRVNFKETIWTGKALVFETGIYVTIILVIMFLYTVLRVQKSDHNNQNHLLNDQHSTT